MLQRNLDAAKDAVLYVKRIVAHGATNQPGDWFMASNLGGGTAPRQLISRGIVQNAVGLTHAAEATRRAVTDRLHERHPELMERASTRSREVLQSVGTSARAMGADRLFAAGGYFAAIGTPHPRIWSDARRALLFQVGNCQEQAALAFHHLYYRHASARPLDFMEAAETRRLTGGKRFFHAFVVIGRVADSDPADHRTWGEAAVVCDPWHTEERTFSSGSRGRWYPAIEAPQQLYRFAEVSTIVSRFRVG